MPLNTITVGELLRVVSRLVNVYGPNMPVGFSSNYGDYAKTQQFHTLNGEAQEVNLVETAYSDSGFAVARGDENSTREDPDAVVLT